MTTRCLVAFLTAVLAAFLGLSAAAQPTPPSYAGEVCLSGNTVTVTVTSNPTASAILIYPTPPGGGYFMDNNGSGTFSKSFTGLSAGQSFSFRLVVQAPNQFEYAPHIITLAAGCTAFSFEDDGGGDDGGGTDDGGGIDPGDFGGGGLPNSRAFRHDVRQTNGQWAVLLETGAPASPLPAVNTAAVNYRINGGPVQRQSMSDLGSFVRGRTIPDLNAGDELTYSFIKTVGIEPVETAWFTRTVGEAAPPIPTDPIETVAALRFRDRHENEWRFDHYPAGYDVGRTFDLRITDLGQRLDIELTTAPEVPVGAVDIKWFNQAGDVGFCDRNISASSQRMAGGNGHFTSSITNLVHGQRVDIEFTLLAGQTYYSEFIYYYMGDGRLQRETQNPYAYAADDASIPVITVNQFAFNQHALNLPPAELGEFMAGKTIFETRWDDGLLFNPPTAFDCNGGPVGFNMGPSPNFEPGLLGPLYTNNSCIECHMLDGRGRAPSSASDSLEDYVVRISIPGSPGSSPTPHPMYGVQLDIKAVPGATPEGNAAINWQYVNGTFDDGTPYQLRRPQFQFTDLIHGQFGTNIPGEPAANAGTPYNGEAEISVRVAPMLIGLGLLEAVDDAEILAWADENDSNNDGISGKPNMVTDRVTGQTALGRFGWKAGEANLQQQTASAFAHDMGMSTGIVNTGPVEVDDASIDSMVSYLRGLAVPPRNNYRDPAAIEGKALFEVAGCMDCHRPTMRTASDADFAPYRDLVIQPFTDMLLHDMGEDLADNRPEYAATGREWRTAPLWGLGYVGHVLGTPTDPFNPNGNPAEPNFLHDGRARSLMEAILWHGGEAEAARNAVLAMNADERDALIAYVEFPFVDPIDTPTTQPCLADANNDGQLTPGDFNAWILAFNTQAPECDQNDDGLCTPADFNAWVLNYNAGC